MKFTDLLQQSDTPVQDDPFIIGDGEDNTPSYIRDQTPIKGKSTANIISEGIDQFGKAVVEDPVGVAKAIGTGIYEGGKEFVQNPVETTTEFVSGVGQSIANVGTKSLEDYLPEGVTEDSATADQMTQARQERLSDYLNASIVVPAAGTITAGAKLAAASIPDLDTVAQYFKDIDLEFDPNTLGSNLGNVSLKKVNKNIRNYGMKNVNNLMKAIGDYSTIKTGGGKIRDALLGVKVENGTMVALRPNLNSTIPNNPLGVPDNPFTGKKGETRLTTVHDGSKWTTENPEGSVYSFLPYAVAENVIFKVNQNSRRQIASKIHGIDVPDAANKFPSMSVVGSFNGDRNLLDEGLELVEIGVNPATNHLFVDMSTGHAVKSADAAMTIGDRVYAVGVKYWNAEDAPKAQLASDGTELPNTVKFKYANAAEEAADNNTVPATVAEQTEDLLGNRISTRVPIQDTKKTGKVILPETYNRDLVIDTDVMREAGTLDKNIDFLATRRDGSSDYDGVDAGRYFPAFKGLENLDPEARLEYVNAMQQKNLEFILDRLPKQFQDRTKVWYEGANRIAGELADKYGVPQSAMSATIAALSPQMDWFSNVSLAERLVDVVVNKRNMVFTPEMEAAAKKYPVFLKDKNRPIFESIKGKTYAELETDMQKAMWIRAYDQAYNPRTHRSLTPEGEVGDIILNADGRPKAVSWGNFGEIAKAVKAVESNGDLNIISDALGEQHKVRNFYNNIEVPFSDFGDVTIDTHAIAAGYMKPLGGSDPLVSQGLGTAGSSSKGYGAKGIYGVTADVYRNVADDRGFMPRETQSIVWEAIRTLFDKDKKTLANKQKVNQIWNAYDRGDLTQEQALGLIEETFGSFPQKVIDPNEKRTIKGGASTMFNKGGLVTGLMSPEEM